MKTVKGIYAEMKIFTDEILRSDTKWEYSKVCVNLQTDAIAQIPTYNCDVTVFSAYKYVV